jgi:DNA polymerase III epsilon subunit-like protein
MTFRSRLSSFIEKSFPSHLLGNEHIAVIDTETTGFTPLNNDIICLSCEIRDLDWSLKGEFTGYYSPQTKKRWSPHAEKVHGFSYEEACSFDHPRVTDIKFLNFLKEFKTDDNKPILFVAHDKNGFDFKFTEWSFRWHDLQYSFFKVFNQEYRVSTVKMGEIAGYPKNKLNIWAERIGFDLDHHEVKSDRIACSKVFKHLMESDNELAIN